MNKPELLKKIDTPDKKVPIVVIGASAGGLKVYQTFFDLIPRNVGAAYIVMQHLSPTHKSLAADLLRGHHTSLPVQEVTEIAAVQPNTIYLSTAGKDLIYKDGMLVAASPISGAIHYPIDRLLNSFSVEHHESLIFIILSGAGSDGTRGALEIREHGGIVIAQDPTTAEYDSMPKSVVQSGSADLVLPIERIPEAVVSYLKNYHSPAAADELEKPFKIDLGALLTFVQGQTGYDFAHYKRGTILRRIARRMGLLGVSAFGAYYQMLQKDKNEAMALVNDFLIGVTSFFRDPQAWDCLRNEVIAPLIEKQPVNSALRIWAPACSTGEESYTLAILILDEMEKQNKRIELQIFATDINERILDTGRKGEYSESQLSTIPKEYVARFFRPLPDRNVYIVNKQLRESVVFAHQNLLGDPPFSKLDLVVCRNLLIYLEQPVQEEVMRIFHFALNDGGYLFMGMAETVGHHEELFSLVAKSCHIFRKISQFRKSSEAMRSRAVIEPFRRKVPENSHIKTPGVDLEKFAQTVIMERYCPATVLVDDKLTLVYVCGPVHEYLRQPPGPPLEKSLMLLIPEEIRAAVRIVIHSALKSPGRKMSEHAAMGTDEKRKPIRITAEGLVRPINNESFVLLTFGPVSPETLALLPSVPAELPEHLMLQLEYELRVTREELQSNIEQHRSVNEELQSSNEELQVTNEELETSREELQSVNEELTTVNSQLREKVEEVEAVNNDLSNFISSSAVPTLFLDSALKIRRFTSTMQQHLNLVTNDIGRPITDLSSSFIGAHIEEDSSTVLKTLRPVEREIKTEDGAWFIRRTLPYRTTDNRIGGVILTYLDFTERIRMEEKLRQSAAKLKDVNTDLLESRRAAINIMEDAQVARLRAEQASTELGKSEGRFQSVLDNSRDVIVRLNLQTGAYDFVSRSVEELVGYSPDEFIAMDSTTALTMIHPDDVSASQAAMARAAETGTADAEYRQKTKQGDYIWVSNSLSVVKDTKGLPLYQVNGIRDITKRKQEEDALHESEERFRAAFEGCDIAMSLSSPDGQLLKVNTAYCKLLGYSENEMLALTYSEFMYPQDIPLYRSGMQYLFNGRIATLRMEKRSLRKDGGLIWGDLSCSLVKDRVGQPLYVVTYIQDVTERKRVEKALSDDLEGLTWLQKISMLYPRDGNVEPILDKILDAAIAISGSDFGSIQLIDSNSSDLKIVAHRGFPEWWIDFWNNSCKGTGCCGTALERGERVIVEDVEQSPIFIGTQALEIQLRAGVRAVQSTPLMGWSGRIIGMISTHFKTPQKPDDRALRMLDLLARHATDIIEQANAEKELRESEDRFHTMANAMAQLAWIGNADGYITWYNHRWYEYTGTTPEQMEGWGWQSVHDPVLLPAMLDRWKNSLATGDPFEMDFPLRGADGQFRQFLTRGYPLKDGEGHVMKWFGTNTDISELKSIEQELQHRATELASANKELEFFSFAVSHDLRNPLNGIIACTQALAKDTASGSTRQQGLDLILKSATRMAQIITDLLALSNVSRTSLSRKSVDLGEIARDFSTELAQHSPQRTIDWKIATDLIVNADPGLMQNLLENLLRNAWKFTTLQEYAIIEIGSLATNGQRTFFVRDNGAGFDMKDVDKLFKPYQRIHSQTDFKGSGIGLSIVKRIVERHDGAIWAEGETGKGAVFYFNLP